MLKQFLQREWLHIHVLDGSLYVFADDGHWIDSPDCGWDKAQEVTFKQLAEECWLGPIDEGDHMFRIRINPGLVTTKFGIQYVADVT